MCQQLILVSVQSSLKGNAVRHTAGRNAVVTSLMVCCGFVVCWSINEIAFFLNFVGYTIDFSGWFYHLTAILKS